MTNHIIRKIHVVLVIFVVITHAYSEHVTRSLCEDRCESSIPHFRLLRTVWQRMSKRIGVLGKQDMSFEAFIKSLVVASERYTWLKRIRGGVLSMISGYHTCAKACEHQHSKRTSERAFVSIPSAIEMFNERLLFITANNTRK